jgi:hypothetical protein
MTSAALRGLAIGFGLLLVASPALANPGINGYSGKPIFGNTDTCDSACHQPTAPAPKLTLTLPESVAAGSTSKVTIVVEGTRARTSLDAAFTTGVKTIEGQNTKVPFPTQTPEEIVAVTPPPPGASGTYEFSFVAPATNGTITLWVAGMSADGAGSGGDGVAKTTRMITVTGGTSADAGSTPTDGGGGDPGAPASDKDASAGSSSGNSSGSGSGARRIPPGDDGGCSMPSHRKSSTSAAILVLAVVAGAMRRRWSHGRNPRRATTLGSAPRSRG